VQPRVAESTRVCSYDRAGLGRSDRGPSHEVVEQIVSDLHSGLQAAGEKAPFVDAADAQLDFLSRNTLHIEATGSGHEIHLFQPGRVVEGISGAIAAVRSGTPLSAR
jgi:hypothetical protein